MLNSFRKLIKFNFKLLKQKIYLFITYKECKRIKNVFIILVYLTR